MSIQIGKKGKNMYINKQITIIVGYNINFL